jgi:hypothetical protein
MCLVVALSFAKIPGMGIIFDIAILYVIAKARDFHAVWVEFGLTVQ